MAEPVTASSLKSLVVLQRNTKRGNSHNRDYRNSLPHQYSLPYATISQGRCGEMADAQDLKIYFWCFPVVSLGCSANLFYTYKHCIKYAFWASCLLAYGQSLK
jgi:hypothetical protein